MLTPEELYNEYSADTNAYYSGLSSESQFRQAINLVREDPNGISVQRVSVLEGAGPGEVIDTMPRQLMVDTIDANEAVVLDNESDLRVFILVFNADSFQFTAGLKSQILAITSGGTWANTRDNLIALQFRLGSRSEELQGLPTSQSDNQAVQDYWIENNLTPIW